MVSSNTTYLKRANSRATAINIAPYLAIFAAVLLSLFIPWEMGGESWGYWYFSKALLAGEGFVNVDRSPAYTLYLLLFQSLPYPYSINAEYVFSGLFVAVSFYLFLANFCSARFALIAAIVWLPIFQTYEPILQKFGLALVLIGFHIRISTQTKISNKLCYLLLLLAALTRAVFVFGLLLLVIFDLIAYFKKAVGQNANSPVDRVVVPLTSVALYFIAGVFFGAFKSGDVWNNVYFASTSWFPGGGTFLTAVQGPSWYYIETTHGSFDEHDFWFAHPEAFGSANNLIEMTIARPLLMTQFFLANAYRLLSLMSFSFPEINIGARVVRIAFKALFLPLLLYGAYRFSRNRPIVQVFLLAMLSSVLVTVLVSPSQRYMAAIAPLIALSAWYFVGTMQKQYPNANKLVIGSVIFGLFHWLPLSNIVESFKSVSEPLFAGHAPQILEGQGRSMHHAHDEISREIKECHGVM